jgi:hypothetical protein
MGNGKTIHTKIRNLENSITRHLNPALEKAERSGSQDDLKQALEKAERVIVLAKRIRKHVGLKLSTLGPKPDPSTP